MERNEQAAESSRKAGYQRQATTADGPLNSSVANLSLLNRTTFNPDVDATFEENEQDAERNEQATESSCKAGYHRQATTADGALNSGVSDHSLVNRTAFNPDLDATFDENDEEAAERNEHDATLRRMTKRMRKEMSRPLSHLGRQDTNASLPLQMGR